MVNAGINKTSAVLRAPYRVFQSNADALGLMRSLMEEVVALAPEAGVDLRPEDVDEWEKVMMTLSPLGKTSMLQDVKAGRKTEVEIFAGRVLVLVEKYDVSIPVKALVQRIIRAPEGGAGE